MGLSDYVLYRLAKNWPSPIANLTEEFNAEPGTDAYNMAYAQHQFDWRVSRGMLRSVTGLDVLEIGSGHGGISCFMAAVGARSVVAIDLSTRDLQFARRFAGQFAARYSPDYRLPVEFLAMSADRLSFSANQFDLVLADNVFEHFTEPEAVMREVYRVLRPGGGLLVPVFSSILSKYGLHLKHGLKLPWANLFFSERTIIRAMHRLAQVDHKLYELYPGLTNNPKRIRDLRLYGDLNDITYRRFKELATRAGFRVESFSPYGTRLGKVLSRMPVVRNTMITDIFSTGASAYLCKTNGLPEPSRFVNAIASTLHSAYRFVRGGGEPSLLRRRHFHERRREAEIAVLSEAASRPDIFVAVKCPACGGSEVSDRFSNPVGFSFSVCACDGTVYMNPGPTLQTLARLYNDESYSMFWSLGVPCDPADYARSSGAVPPAPGQTLLDVGCSTGEFLQLARERFQCYGVEINAETAAIGRQNGFQITTGTLADVEGSERFDVVTMLQVIEHLVDPRQSLADVRRLLKPHGTLYLNTPCVDSASFELFRELHMHVSSFAHVGLYTKAGLERMTQRCGFSMTDHGYCGGMDVALHDLIGYRFARSRFQHRVAFYSPRFLNFSRMIDRLSGGLLAAALRPRGNESYQWAVFKKC
ncbi:MAG: methyltransferase domain-containing protein [Pirellulales bacterium]